MVVTITKTLPISSWYTSSGATTITLSGVNSITVNSKKSLIKLQVPMAPSNTGNSGSDKGLNYVTDLKKVEDNIKLRGWLVDTTASSAWTQAWKLRAMSVVGGPISSLVIEDQTFGTGTQQAFLEEVNFIAYPNRTVGLTIQNTNSTSIGVARIEVDLNFYLGNTK